MATVGERRVRLWQGKIETQIDVIGDGPPLVFLHGPWGLRSHRDFLDHLACNILSLPPDTPGPAPEIPMRSISSTSYGTWSSITASCSTGSASERPL